MEEIAPGVVHRQTYHEGIHAQVSSYMLVAGRVVLDPRAPEEGFDELARQFGTPRAAFRALVPLSPDHLLLAHGLPVVGDGRLALAALADGDATAVQP